jgi:uncharacterized protein (DUF2147 family)
MIAIIKRAIGPLVISCGTAFAASEPTGVWLDHTGRGAVEITNCNGNLCGRLVWFKDQSHQKEGCGFQIIGNVKPVAGGKWDGGWIIDPEKDPNKKYDVEITPQGEKLKVMGYAGMKFLSETMIWTRAPANLQRCDSVAKAPTETTPAPTPAPITTPAPAATPAPTAAPKRNDEPPTVYPPPAEATPAPAPPPVANPEPPKRVEREAPTASAKPGKDCKVEFGGISLTFPCPE